MSEIVTIASITVVLIVGWRWWSLRNQVSTLQQNLLTALDDLATLDAENRALLQERSELEQENKGLSAALNESEATIQRQSAMLAARKYQPQMVKSIFFTGDSARRN